MWSSISPTAWISILLTQNIPLPLPWGDQKFTWDGLVDYIVILWIHTNYRCAYFIEEVFTNWQLKIYTEGDNGYLLTTLTG